MLTLLVLKLVAGIVTANPPEPAPGAAFSAAAADRFAAGWELAVVDVVDDGTELHAQLTLVDGDRAERLELWFDADGDRALAFRRAATAAPKQPRVYRNREEIATLLSGGPVHTIYPECGTYFLEGRGGGASLAPDDYYVVDRTATGASAHRVLARVMASAFEHDARLTAVLPVPGGVDLVLLDGTEEVLHVGLDPDGRVASVERRWSPSVYHSWDTSYVNESALARALRSGRAVEALSFDEGGAGAEPTLTMRMADGEFVVDMADFAADEDDMEDFGCGC